MRRKTVIPNRGRWSSLSLFRQIHLGEGKSKNKTTPNPGSMDCVEGLQQKLHKDALMQCRCCCMPLGGWPKGPHTSLPHVMCGRHHSYSRHLTLTAVTRFHEFNAEGMVLITGYWLTGPMNLDRSVLHSLTHC